MKVPLRCLRAIVISSVGLVWLFALFVPSANAATGTKHTGPNGVPGVDYCLNVQMTAYTVGMGNNFVDQYADVYNGCGATVTGTLTLYASVTTCPGLGNGNGTERFNFTLGNGRDYSSPTVNWSAGCVTCENGVAIAYPAFSMRFSATAGGNFSGTKRAGSYGSPPKTIDLTNDPPEVYPQCP